jgi:integrase
MRDTGMRNERELYRIRIEDIDFEAKSIFVPDSKTPKGRRLVPMSHRVIEILSIRCEGRTEGWVFPSDRGKSGHLTTISHQFQEARRKAGLPEELVPYCARHDFGTRILSKIGNLKAVMEVMGHKDVHTAMRYQHPDIEIVRLALNDKQNVKAGSGNEG